MFALTRDAIEAHPTIALALAVSRETRNPGVTLVGSAGSVVHTTPLTTAQAGIVGTCQVPTPAVVTALDPV